MLTNLYVKTVVALEQFRKDERGVTAIEYAVIAVAVAGIVAAVFSTTGDNTLRGALEAAFENLTELLSEAVLENDPI